MSQKISVVMPAHNVERYIARAIRSVLNQSYRNFELIVVDDGSTDGTTDVVRQFSDSRIQLIRNDTNLGQPYARNRGLARASGEYYACMDADDECLANRFASQVAFFKHNPHVGVLGGWIISNIPKEGRIRLKKYPALHLDCLRYLASSGPCFAHPTVMIRRKEIIKVLRYDETYSVAGDYKLWVDLFKHTSFANLQQSLIMYHLHPNSVTLTRAAEQSVNAKRIRREFVERVLGRELGNRFRDEISWIIDPKGSMAIDRLVELDVSLNARQSLILSKLLNSSIRHSIHRITFHASKPVLNRLMWTFLRYKLMPAKRKNS